ncbi:hypothetical protein [Dolichospermum circinale]|uniref:hypothetical protein n=1 Tax=Dolichospermum circinale TaxID=109265 RepID=UPI0023305A68|nr:hypothetical protein [Dolichospermum circinale]MDB9484543.1 hypothetical protein [Dolichospermum circinale CS-537/05]MDB9455167.1 hypothetical protein [Dolichospermum circinale CS-541/06]MDB9461555.1 hypothetical protein [Dolichospermum circinale CS-541/04]MDB9476755.1 hypothetical protein [Dolichospermum circinale CS-537/11]MDB9480314.1 hypothetical protein [Dolichospermum circinale CS-537/03]
MLLTSSTDLLNSEAGKNFVTEELCSIETCAESLMNEIFADIDTILDGSSEENCDQTEEKYIHNCNGGLIRTDASLSPKVKHSLTSASLVKSPLKTDLVVNSSFPGAITTTERSQTSGLDKLTYMGLGWSMATLCTLCLMNFALLNTADTQLNSSSQNNQTLGSVNLKSDSKLDLVNYMLSAFLLIEQQEKSNYTTTVKPKLTNVSFKPNNSLPLPSTQQQITQPQIKASPLPIAGNNLPPVPQVAIATNTTNKKNIPVDQSPVLSYEPQIKASPLPIAGNNLPPVPQVAIATNAINKKNIPVDQFPDSVYQQPTISSVRIPQPSPSVVNNPPIKNVQPATQPKTKKTEINSQPLKEAPAKLATVTSTISVQLEGILESGNQSAALFNIDGSTRRVNLGENIGGTGWILIEISNAEAIIRRHGEKRSIYAGQRL